MSCHVGDVHRNHYTDILFDGLIPSFGFISFCLLNALAICTRWAKNLTRHVHFKSNFKVLITLNVLETAASDRYIQDE